MIIKLRHLDYAEAVDFAEGDLDQLNDLIHLIQRNGCYCKGDDCEYYDWQFVLEDGVAFAEIILENP